MTVERVLPCICSSAKLNDDRFCGMPVLQVVNTNRSNLQYWRVQCPKCGRGGILDFNSAYKALKSWNDMQRMLHNSVGVYKIPLAAHECYMPRTGKRKCFTAGACSGSECPNIQYDSIDEKYGYGIADDMGLERIKCKDCKYNTGKCEDCIFHGNPDYCPEVSDDAEEEAEP